MLFIAPILQALLAVSGRLASSSAVAGRPSWLDHTFPRPQDSKAQWLCQYQGEMIPVVNTASVCRFAGQYKGLEFVHDKNILHRDAACVGSYRSLIAPDRRTFDARIERWLAEKP